jgi:hypothetical protein
MKFAVITKIPDDLDGNYYTEEMLVSPKHRDIMVGSGNYVSPPEEYIGKHYRQALQRNLHGIMKIEDDEEYITFVSVPVFSIGEILVMDEGGRTIPDGRKPTKWSVEFEMFEDIESAIERAKQVMEEDMKRWM